MAKTEAAVQQPPLDTSPLERYSTFIGIAMRSYGALSNAPANDPNVRAHYENFHGALIEADGVLLMMKVHAAKLVADKQNA